MPSPPSSRLRTLRAAILIPAFLVCVHPATAADAPAGAAAASRADEKLLRHLEARFARTVAAKDRAAFLAFWAQDAAIFPATGGPVVGPAKIWENWGPIVEGPDFSLSSEPGRARIAASAALGCNH